MTNPFAKPSVWGPPAWTFLHSVTMTYPEHPTAEDAENMEKFLDSVGPILPCKLCRSKYHDYLAQHRPDLRDRDHLVRWMIRLHNSINTRLKKPRLSMAEALRKIQNECRQE
jgi:FAD-linked sulfhydryl oxidase